jgi:sarcosine oxidase subunit beta
MLRGYLAAAERLGARIEWGVDVKEIVVTNGKASGLVTSRGRVAVDAVVNAAGAWAGTLECAAGDELPVVPLRRQVAVSERSDVLPERMPMTIFVDSGFHLRVRDGRVLLLWPSAGAPDNPFDTRVEDDWIASVAAKAAEHLPSLRNLVIDREAALVDSTRCLPTITRYWAPRPGAGISSWRMDHRVMA